jgi:hypothetical protein
VVVEQFGEIPPLETPMLLDANTLNAWLNALKLPGRMIAGLFLACMLALLFDYLELLRLADLGVVARPVIIIATLLFGSLSIATIGGIIYDAYMRGRRTTVLSARRDTRRAEKERDRADFQARVLKRADYLSRKELRIVADCLRKNQQSFKAWVHDPDVSNLMAKQFVGSPGGTHHQDHYPFYFADFVWDGLLARKDELIAKDDDNNRTEAAEQQSRRRVTPYR